MGEIRSGLGGAEGYGELAVPRSDDGSVAVDVSSVFAAGFRIGITSYSGSAFYVNTNGSVSFGGGVGALPASLGGAGRPLIAPFMADVDTRQNGEGPESGGIWVDLDPARGAVTVTWAEVGYYRYGAARTNLFQLELLAGDDGGMTLSFRYGDIEWASGIREGGVNGLGGSAAQAGLLLYGPALLLPGSGDEAAVLDLESRAGNTGKPGLWVYQIGPTGAVLTDTSPRRIAGTAGHDRMEGRSGNDTLLGSPGADTMIGGAGQDLADYSAAPARIVLDLDAPTRNMGWASGDRFSSIEQVTGTAFDDRLYGSAAANILSGGEGSDLLYGRGGNDTLFGGGGDDRLSGDAGTDLLYGGAGHDRLLGGAGDDRLVGDAGYDTLIGEGGNDVLIGGEGNDHLSGREGDDTLVGGPGADVMHGGAGFDLADYLQAPSRVVVDLLDSSRGRGWASGDSFIQIEAVRGSAHDDRIYGNQAANVLDGRDGDDGIWGRGGNDTIQGSYGNDTLFGGDGRDRLLGGPGNDQLFGGAGADWLQGDVGHDTLTGDAGADAFVFHPGGGRDRITDFALAEDRLLLDASLSRGLSAPALLAEMAVMRGDTMVLVLAPDLQIWIDGVSDQAALARQITFF